MSFSKMISFEELNDLLECPVCLETPTSGHVFQCQNGHLVCVYLSIIQTNIKNNFK
jgi:hypothetical protein